MKQPQENTPKTSPGALVLKEKSKQSLNLGAAAKDTSCFVIILAVLTPKTQCSSVISSLLEE